MPILNFIRQTANLFKKFIFKGGKITIHDLIIKWCLYLIVFLIPLFFLPVTSDALELPKTLLFYLLVLIATIAWLTKMAVKKEVFFVHTFLDIPIIIFGFIYIVSTIFSVNRYNSLVGTAGYFSETLLTVLFLILFFFLVVNNVRQGREILKLIIIFLISSSLLIIFNFFQIFGLYFLPWVITKNINFDLISGSPTILTIFLTTIIPLIFGLLITGRKKVSQWLLLTLLFLDLLLIFILDSFIGIISLIIGLFILILFLTSRSNELKSKWIIIPTLILALSVLVLFISVSNLTGIVLPIETNLPYGTSSQIIWSAVADSPLLGVGPENFSYIFSKYKPLEFNQTNLWNLNFNWASNFWFNLLAGTGLLGTLVILVICFWYIIKTFKDFIWPSLKKPSDFNWYLKTSIFITWLILFFSSFFYFFSFVTIFLFWLFLALGIGLEIGEKESILSSVGIEKEFKKDNTFAFFSSLSFSLFLILSISFIYFASRYVLADVYFVRAVNLVSPLFIGEEKFKLEETISKINQANDYLISAIKLNPYEKNYHFSLAKILMAKMQIVARQGGRQAEEALNNLIGAFGNEVQIGINLDKNSVVSYFSALNLYKTLRNLIGASQVDPLILNTYNQVISLDSNNPEHYLGRGQIYLTDGQLTLNSLENIKDEKDKQNILAEANQMFNLSEQDFNRAINLKPDLVLGYYNLALVKETKGDKEGAIKELEKALSLNSLDLDVLYNLGRMYLENNKLDEAINVLSRAANLYPKHSNSHWLLSSAFEKRGEKEKAIKEMETVLKLNPDNEIVKKKIEELKK